MEKLEHKFQVGRPRSFLEIANIKKRTSLHISYNEKKKLYTVVIPYDEISKKYKIQLEEIDIFENKEYIMATLEKLNQMFNLNKLNIPLAITVLISLMYIILILFIMYIAIILSLLCLFNPLIILFILGILMQIVKLLVILFYSVKDHYKKRVIKRILQDENKNCEWAKISWHYGRDGSWLEVVRKED